MRYIVLYSYYDRYTTTGVATTNVALSVDALTDVDVLFYQERRKAV